ncbi:MAG TPA: hypothetical protein VKA50_03815 [Gammaproteobacteria bacterium]|nr:hypothetical protein [Gammaproteobacteria bacterium]
MIGDPTEPTVAYDPLNLEPDAPIAPLADDPRVIIWALDQNGSFTLSEGGGLTLMGLEPDALVGASVFECCRDHPEIIAHAARALSGEPVYALTAVHHVVFQIEAHPIVGPHGQVASVMGIAVARGIPSPAPPGDKRYRDALKMRLLRVVHDRIGNALQGSVALLHRHTIQNRDLAEPVSAVIAQLNALAIAHGLRGTLGAQTPRLKDIVEAICLIARPAHAWGRKIDLRQEGSDETRISYDEAVPVSLAINELVACAVRSGEGMDDSVRVHLKTRSAAARLTVVSRRAPNKAPAIPEFGMIRGLLPAAGAHMEHHAIAGTERFALALRPPVLAVQ